MSKILIIAWRDFKQTVMRPIFVIAVFGLPVLMIAIGGVAVLVMSNTEQPPLVGTVAVVERGGEVAESAAAAFSAESMRKDQQEQLEQFARETQEALTASGGMGSMGPNGSLPLQRGEIRIDVEHVDADDEASIDAVRSRVRDGALLAAAIITPEVLAPTDPPKGRRTFRLFVKEDLDSDHTGLIERRIGQAIVAVRAARADLDRGRVDALLARPRADTARALKSGEDASEGEGTRALKMMIPMVFMMLMWIATFTAGQHLLMSTIEEKSNRVMEVLLSAVSPLQLMTGKILGQGGVGLLIVLLYSSVGVGALIVSSFFHLIGVLDLVYLAVFFFMAYFMVASLMAAVGSAVSDIREANALMTPVMLVLMVPLMLWMPISQAPNGSIATACSFIPPAIPFAMILRLAADEPVPMWQIPVAIAWGYFCVFAMIWMAAKIFRVGVLMYGKPPSPVELVRWLRYS